MIKPFTNPQISLQIQFNIIHSSYRVVVENAFSRLKNRFIVLKGLKTRKFSFAIKLTEYAIILHNFLKLNNDNLEDLYDKNDDDNSDDNGDSDSDNDSDNDDNESIINQNEMTIRREGERKRKQILNQIIHS